MSDSNFYTEHYTNEEPVTVFVGGFPKTTNVSLVDQYLATICLGNDFIAVTDANNNSRGFAFVTFKSIEEATDFVKQKFIYNGKVLDTRISLNNKDFINTSLLNIREPKKVFVDKIPNYIKKDDLYKIFEKFGDIEEIILLEKRERPINFAYVTFYKHLSAKKCVEKKSFDCNSEKKMIAIYARPKFTKKMLTDLHPVIVEYIVSIEEGRKQYHPKDFKYLQDVILKDQRFVHYSNDQQVADLSQGMFNFDFQKRNDHPNFPQQRNYVDAQYYNPTMMQNSYMNSGADVNKNTYQYQDYYYDNNQQNDIYNQSQNSAVYQQNYSRNDGYYNQQPNQDYYDNCYYNENNWQNDVYNNQAPIQNTQQYYDDMDYSTYNNNPDQYNYQPQQMQNQQANDWYNMNNNLSQNYVPTDSYQNSFEGSSHNSMKANSTDYRAYPNSFENVHQEMYNSN